MQTLGSDSGNGQGGDSSKPFKAAKVVIGEVKLETVDNIVSSYVEALLITVNGETWVTRISPFLASTENVFSLWERKPQAFRRVLL